LWRVAENHEFDAKLIHNEPFEQLESDTTEAISVCDHNLLELSLARSFQKGLKVGAMPVATGANVAEDGGVWSRTS
jgi:hypothetical protein